MNKKILLLLRYALIGIAYLFAFIAIILTGVNAAPYCSETKDGRTDYCTTSMDCHDVPAVVINYIKTEKVKDKETDTEYDFSCTWTYYTALAGILSIVASMVLLAFLALSPRVRSSKFSNILVCLGPFTLVTLLTSFVIMVAEISSGREMVRVGIIKGLGKSSSYTQGVFIANAIFIFFDFVLVSVLHAYELMIADRGNVIQTQTSAPVKDTRLEMAPPATIKIPMPDNTQNAGQQGQTIEDRVLAQQNQNLGQPNQTINQSNPNVTPATQNVGQRA